MASILIVDDAHVSRTVLRENLKKRGYEVAGETGDGEEAIALYEKLHPDLVTLDITMPGMNGMDCLKRIREIDPRSRVLMVTALGTLDRVQEAIQLGCVGFIKKPFDWNELYEAVEKGLKT